jgi:predicted TPR repeat methyltransferase
MLAEIGERSMSEHLETPASGERLTVADAAFRRCDLEAAERLLGQALAGPHRSVEALRLLGKVFFSTGRLEQAAAVFEEACGALPKDAGLHNNLGSALQAQGRLDRSEAEFRQALDLDPKDPRIHYNLALNLELDGRRTEAAERYREALEADPRYVKALVGLGRIHQEQGRAQEAVNAYQQAIKIEPRALEAHLNLGRLLVEQQKYDLAEVCFENALRIDPDALDAHLGLGDVHKDLGRLEQAEHCYRKAVELGSVMARHFLAAVRHEKTAAAPREYVTELFDAYAKDFEGHLVGTLSYQTPRLLREALVAAAGERKSFPLALDLGCGTGLAGVELKPLVGSIEGVDLSPEMLEEARKKGIYATLSVGDIVEHLRGCSGSYDLFVAADVLVYVGALEAVLEGVRERAQPGACFAFNVERLEEGDFSLQLNGRYAHSEPYVRRVAKTAGLNTALCRPVPLRKENEQWVPGLIFVLKAVA